MRVAIVNDMPVAIEGLKRIILTDRSHTIAWTALDGDSAVRQCMHDRPDVILMDLVMPGKSGARATEEIMKQSPCAILVVTATVAGNFKLVSEAMGYGAYDAVETPRVTGSAAGATILLAKLANVDRVNQRLRTARSSDPTKQAFTSIATSSSMGSHTPIVAIGASTGGPAALESILSKLKPSFPAAILIAQHIGEEFALPLVQWLAERCKIRVKTVKPGDRPEPGTAHVAATSDHLVLMRDGTLQYTRHPAENPFRPSVDALFDSIADAGCRPRVAVLLTGIGNDGAKGLLRLRQAGWSTIAQDQASSVVYGMPQAAAKLGAAARILPLNAIATNLELLVNNPQPR